MFYNVESVEQMNDVFYNVESVVQMNGVFYNVESVVQMMMFLQCRICCTNE